MLEVRPYTSPSTAYNAWSTTWPILCVTGPAVAATSLLAIPIMAVAAGGSALASLTAFGSSIGTAVSSATAGAVEGVSATAATVTAAAAKANRLPGAARVRGKLADAARNLVRDQVGRQEVQQRVIRYLTSATGGGAAAAAAGGRDAASHGEEEGTEHEQPEPTVSDLGGEPVQTRGSTGKKLDEVDVTGHDMERVLTCSTGNSTIDKVRLLFLFFSCTRCGLTELKTGAWLFQELAQAFKRLSFKTKFGEFKTAENPVLRIVGGVSPRSLLTHLRGSGQHTSPARLMGPACRIRSPNS